MSEEMQQDNRGDTPKEGKFVPSKGQIRHYDDQVMIEVPVPEWGEGAVVYVKGFTARAQIEFQGTHFDQSGTLKSPLGEYRHDIIVMTACDADGNLLFDDSDREWLEARSAVPVSRIFRAAVKAAGLDASETYEETAKN